MGIFTEKMGVCIFTTDPNDGNVSREKFSLHIPGLVLYVYMTKKKKFRTRAMLLYTTTCLEFVLQDGRAAGFQLSRDCIDRLPDPDDVTAHDLGGVLVADASSQQFGDQVGILGDVFETLGNRPDSIEISTNTNVVIANEVSNIRDVVGNLAQGSVFGVEGRNAVLLAIVNAGDELRRNVDHDDGVGLLDELQDVVLDVARMGADAPGRAVGEDDGCLGPLPVVSSAQRIDHGILAHVGEIDNHADSVHFVHQLAAKRADAAPDGGRFPKGALLQGGIGKLVVAVVRQRRIPHAEIVKQTQVAGQVGNLVKAFDAQGRNQLRAAECADGAGAVDVRRKVMGIGGEEPLHDVDLLQSELQT